MSNGADRTRHQFVYDSVCLVNPKSERMDPQLVQKVFVDMGHMSKIKNNTHQCIEGRRGTGKTHLFVYLTNDINNSGSEAAVYIDIREARVESIPDAPPHVRAKDAYNEILKYIFRELRDRIDAPFYDQQPMDPTLERQCRNAKMHLNELIRLINEGQYVEVKSAEKQRAKLIEKANEIEGSIDIDVKTQNPSLGVRLKEGVSRLRRTSESEKSTFRKVIPFSAIKDCIENFLSEMGIDALWIFLDEWSDLPTDSQPFLAELLKRTFFSSRTISIKIATIPFQTKLGVDLSSQKIGLELNGDIYLGINLDDSLVYAKHAEACHENFSKLLYNHVFLNVLSKEDFESEFANHSIFIRKTFTKASFERLLKFSHGNPRDCITLFTKSYLYFYASDSNQINSDHVNQAAKDLGAEKAEQILDDKFAQNVLDSIIKYVFQDRQMGTFMVPVSYARDKIIQQLLHHRLIHVWDKSYSSYLQKGSRFMVLALDFCLIVDQLKAPNYRHILPQLSFDFLYSNDDEGEEEVHEKHQKIYDDLPKPDKRSARSCILPDSILKQNDKIECPSCLALFSPNHPIFEKFQVCPECAGEITDPDT